MRHLHILIRALQGILFLTLILAVARPTEAAPKKSDRPSPDQQAIEAIIARLPEAVLKREIDTIASFLTDSVEVTIYGRKAKGKDNIRSLLNVGLTRFIDVVVETKTEKLTVAETRAAQVGYFKYTIEWPMGGTSVRDGDFVAGWQQVNDNWRLASLVVTPPKPAESAPEKK